MSTSPTSPSSRKRQQAGAPAQSPQAIAPAPSATAQNTAATAISPSSTSQAPLAANPTPINVEATAKHGPDTSVKSPTSPTSARKRKAAEMVSTPSADPAAESGDVKPPVGMGKAVVDQTAAASATTEAATSQSAPPAKKSRTNTPWTPAEERKLKTLRDAGSSWSEIAKEFPHRTEGSVKKHWYKDMHYADFGEDESAALLAAIREYEANKWKEIGKKVGKPAKACEQYAREHFSGKL